MTPRFPRLVFTLLLIGWICSWSSGQAQLLDLSTVMPEYQSSNPRVQQGRFGGDYVAPLRLFQPLTSLNFLSSTTAANSIGRIYPRLMVRYLFRETYFCNLCLSYLLSDDRRTITFELRRGLEWTDGQPITAHDIVSSARILSDPGHTSTIRQRFLAPGGVVEFVALDDYRVQAHLPAAEAEATWQQRMWFPVFPDHIWGRAYREGGITAVLALHSLGSTDLVSAGGWRFGAYDPDTRRMILASNRDLNWWTDAWGNRLPYFDRLIIAGVRDEVEALADGIVHHAGLGTIDQAAVERLTESGAVIVEDTNPGGSVTYWLIPNFSHNSERIGALLRDDRFRMALSHLIDRHAFVGSRIGHEVAQPAFNWNLEAGYKDLPYPRRDFDPQAATALLREIGMRRESSRSACPGGCFLHPDGRPLVLRLTQPDRPEMIRLAAAIADQLRSGGIEVVHEIHAGTEYEDRLRNRSSPRFRDLDLMFEFRTGHILGRQFRGQIFSLGGELRYWGMSRQPGGELPYPAADWERRLAELTAINESDAPAAVRVAAVAEATMLFAQHLPMIPIASLRILQAYDWRLANTLDQVTGLGTSPIPELEILQLMYFRD